MSYLDSPILITGCARSGTSMVSGIIDRCGAWGGAMSGATQHNKKGMYENAEIRDTMVKPLLRELKVDPMGQNPLPDVKVFYAMDSTKWKERTLRIIKSQGYTNEGLWMYKGAKACLIHPLWSRAFPNAKWVIVRRDDEDIIASCLRTGFMRAYKGREGWKKWVGTHLDRFAEMRGQGLCIVEVWPQKIIDGDFREIKNAVEWLGLEWNDKIIRDFVAPELWKRGKN